MLTISSSVGDRLQVRLRVEYRSRYGKESRFWTSQSRFLRTMNTPFRVAGSMIPASGGLSASSKPLAWMVSMTHFRMMTNVFNRVSYSDQCYGKIVVVQSHIGTIDVTIKELMRMCLQSNSFLGACRGKQRSIAFLRNSQSRVRRPTEWCLCPSPLGELPSCSWQLMMSVSLGSARHQSCIRH